MRLSVFRKDELIKELELSPGQSYQIGRQEDSDIILDKLPGISRKHFQILFQDGQWLVSCQSEMKLLKYKGSEEQEFLLSGQGEFTLSPYRFVFQATDAHSDEIDFSSNGSSANDNFELGSEPGIENNPGPVNLSSQENSAPEPDDDEQTAIQTFSGLPYIKIMGYGGRKSEYFRLEGNLWVVGRDENASVYVNEPLAEENHFEISKTDRGFFVIDLGSRQGTDLNGEKVKPKKAHKIVSGDIITIGSTSLQFELRDQSFKKRVSSVPASVHKNPLVFFDQDVAMVTLEEPNLGEGQAQEIFDTTPEETKPKKNPLRQVLLVVAACAVGFMVYQNFAPKEEAKDQMAANDPLAALNPEERKMVTQTYKLANQLYLDRNYELALVQLQNLHEIIPSYKNSREIEDRCISAREVEQERARLEQQRREQEELEEKVNSYISQCESQYRRSDDIDGAKACLLPASDLDPNNPRITNLITEVTSRFEATKIRRKLAAERAEKVARGKSLYTVARNFHKENRIYKAIEAYENHIHSGLPDPKKLVKESRRHLASIEVAIRTEKKRLMTKARNAYNDGDLQTAIDTGKVAQRVDPYDPGISNFVFQTQKELTSKMKNIYAEAIIEEKFGNIEASRIKWEKIVSKDVKSGKYYKKAKRKLKFYGYEYKN